ncbi:MAG: FecR family protein [Colwellia sp.]|nr:FecR family protein [Colwellia sp.]
MFYNTYHYSHTLKIFFKKYCPLVSFLILFFLPSHVMADVAGKTILAKGEVNATNNASQDVRRLRRRSEIFSVDNIITGDKSKAQFSMSDGGLITLKANTEIKISNYQFDQDSKQGSATLEVISGGLRSISGLIKKSGGDYQVKTPVGSIGIRGTHFAVEVVDDNVVFGVFSGNIDVQLKNKQILSLGASEDFAFASVNPAGQVTLMTQAPPSIAAGLSNDEYSDEKSEDSEGNTSSSRETAAVDGEKEQTDSGNYSATDSETTIDASLYSESELQGISGSPIAELIAQRTGTLTYENIINSNISSTQGTVRAFSMSMTIDFDKGSVPDGLIRFSDQQGAWFAVYSGLINVDKLDLGVNFASHGNNNAEGEVSAAFSNGLDEIIGSFHLEETENPQVNAGGSFKIEP